MQLQPKHGHEDHQCYATYRVSIFARLCLYKHRKTVCNAPPDISRGGGGGCLYAFPPKMLLLLNQM